MSTLRERLGITLEVNTDIPFIADFTDVPLDINEMSTIRYSAWSEEERRAIDDYNMREYLSEREFNNFNRQFASQGGIDVSSTALLFTDMYYLDNDNPVNVGCVNVGVSVGFTSSSPILEYIDTSFSEDPIVYDSSGNIDIISFNCDR
jgi:hypothetical protein